MSIFANWGPKYWEAGLSVIPVDGKKPFINGYQKFSDNQSNEEDLQNWEKKYPNYNIGLMCGYNNIACIDLDYEGHGSEALNKLIIEALPPIISAKKGKKNISIFYRTKVSAFKIYHPLDKKITVCELLNRGNMTVIPPSIHPETQNPYEWVHEPLNEIDINTLPWIDSSHEIAIRSIVNYFFEDKKTSEKESRNIYLSCYGFSIMTSCKNIDEFTLKLMEKDAQEFKTNSYYNDRSENKAKDARSFAKAHAERLYKRHKSWLKEKQNKTWDWGFEISSTESEIYSQVVKDIFKEIKKCSFDKQVTGMFLGERVPIENHLNYLKSVSIDRGLSQGKVEAHLYNYLDKIPSSLLINPIPEDNKSIDQILSFVRPKYISQEMFIEVMKEWFANIWRRYENPRFQNFCPILLGEQGIGKTELLNNLLSGWDKYYTSNHTVQDREVENYQVMARKMVLNIGEFDRTSKMNIAALKNMLTTDSASFRMPYARRPTDTIFRCSFISSCNTSNVLIDSTGNRRFIIAEIDDINFDYPKGLEQAVLNYSYFLFKSDFRASDNTWDNLREIVERMSPERDTDVEDEVCEMWEEQAANYCNNNKVTFIKYKLALIIIADIARKFEMQSKTVKRIIKSRGYYNKTEDDRMWLPTKRAFNLKVVK